MIWYEIVQTSREETMQNGMILLKSVPFWLISNSQSFSFQIWYLSVDVSENPIQFQRSLVRFDLHIPYFQNQRADARIFFRIQNFIERSTFGRLHIPCNFEIIKPFDKWTLRLEWPTKPVKKIIYFPNDQKLYITLFLNHSCKHE